METEVPILQQLASGSPGAMDRCMERFGGLVWSLTRRLSSTGSDADDAVQEIFLDIWKSAARFDPAIASETTFVAMIARRRLIDRGRRKQRRLSTTSLGEQVQAEAATLKDSSQQSEDIARATEALGQLRPEQQRILQLSIYHGCSHEEIARSTGMPLGTVKTHARRGLLRLREMLESEGAIERGATNPARQADMPRGDATLRTDRATKPKL